MPEFIDIPLYDAVTMERIKASLDPALVELANEWFPPEENPGLQGGGSGESPILGAPSLISGGGFIESMTTNLERNLACSLNSMAIANVKMHCKKLQRHPNFRNVRPAPPMSCEEIMMHITYELYECYNEKKFGKWRWLWGDPMPTGGLIYRADAFDDVIECKKEIMKKYGIEDKPKLYGWTPNDYAEADWRDPFGDRGIALPALTQSWYDTYGARGVRPSGGRTPTGGPARVPDPPYNPPTASDCCPPPPPQGEGCVVTVGTHFEPHHVATGGLSLLNIFSMGAHMSTGVITSCDPLRIEITEHPLQGGRKHTMEVQEGGTWPPPPPSLSIPNYTSEGAQVQQSINNQAIFTQNATPMGNTADVSESGSRWYVDGDPEVVMRIFIDWIICWCD
tara:strand:- start:1067 stop:2248 length:1182 start_codon:yes stop_codon:yes gene_type:complete